METSITTITKGQEKQVKRFAEDAVDRAFAEGFLDKDKIQKLIENGDEFQNQIIASMKSLSVSNQYSDEETKSKYGYLSGYRKSKPIEKQITRLRELFPDIDLGTANLELADRLGHQLSEGPFAIPDWKLIAPTYPEAVQKVLDLIKETRDGDFYNYRDGQIDKDHLRQNERSKKAWAVINESQSGHGIKIVQAQFGLCHRGRSVRRALEVMSSGEFGLGAFAVGIMILTHKERLQHYDDLWIDCAGDEWSFGADGVFVCAPYLRFGDGKVRFITDHVDYANVYRGSASGFFPQS